MPLPIKNPKPESTSLRKDYLDWLRVITTLCVFAFHSARFFDTFSDWHVKNTSPWIGGDIIVGFMSQWIMPMFMVLAGASSFFSLQSRNAGQYIGERVRRLLVPFLFGLLVIIVPQSYYELLYRGKLPCTGLWSCYSLYLLNLPERLFSFSFYHLWFLAVLFLFSLFCLPLFLGQTKKGKRPLILLAEKINSSWKLMLGLVLPLALINLLIYPGTFWGSRDFGGWCLVAHLLFFISGYLLFANEALIKIMGKLGWFLIIGPVGSAIGLWPLVGQLLDWKTHFGSAGYVAAQTVQALLSWCLLIAFLNLGRQFLNFKNKFLVYARQAVLPFYILHQTVIIVVGYYVVQWKISPGLKYLIITFVSFGLIMAIYDLLVKRFKILRFLFGMRTH